MKICPFCLKPNATGKCVNRMCVVGALNRLRRTRKDSRLLVRVK